MDDISERWREKWLTPEEAELKQTLSITDNLATIREAVTSQDDRLWRWVSGNLHLTESQFLGLFRRIAHEYDRANTLSNPMVSSELLNEVALTCLDPLILGVILGHPKVDEETQVICSLLGSVSMAIYLSQKPSDWPTFP